MNYNIKYDLHQIQCDGHVTRVTIINIETGEVFIGYAKRNPRDAFDIRIGTNVALARAIKKMVATDMDDWQVAIEDGCGWMI